MNQIKEVKIHCELGDPKIGGQIASFTKRELLRQFAGQVYEEALSQLEVAAYEAVRRVRTHLIVQISLQCENGTLLVTIKSAKNTPALIHQTELVADGETEDDEYEEPSPFFNTEQIDESEILVDEVEELPHHRRYWPIQSKSNEPPRWGRTPNSPRSWRRRIR